MLTVACATGTVGPITQNGDVHIARHLRDSTLSNTHQDKERR